MWIFWLKTKLPIIECETWTRDSHGLFDYESNDLIKNTLKISSTANLFRNNNNIEQSGSKYPNSRRADIFLDLSLESIHNTIIDREDGEECKYKTPWKVDNTEQLLGNLEGSNFPDAQNPDSLVHINIKFKLDW